MKDRFASVVRLVERPAAVHYVPVADPSVEAPWYRVRGSLFVSMLGWGIVVFAVVAGLVGSQNRHMLGPIREYFDVIVSGVALLGTIIAAFGTAGWRHATSGGGAGGFAAFALAVAAIAMTGWFVLFASMMLPALRGLNLPVEHMQPVAMVMMIAMGVHKLVAAFFLHGVASRFGSTFLRVTATIYPLVMLAGLAVLGLGMARIIQPAPWLFDAIPFVIGTIAFFYLLSLRIAWMTIPPEN